MVKTFPRLRGRIVERYGSQKKFAEVLGLTEVSISYKLSGKKEFSLKDIIKWCELLDISKEEIGDYFFTI